MDGPWAVLVLDDIDDMRSECWDLNGIILVVLVTDDQWKQPEKWQSKSMSQELSTFTFI